MTYTKYKFTPKDIAGYFISADFPHKRQNEVLIDIFQNHSDSVVFPYRNDFLLLKRTVSDMTIKYESDNETLDEVQIILWEMGKSGLMLDEGNYDRLGAYFKLIKLQLMYSDISCKRIKLRTLLKDFGYKRRTAALVGRINRSFSVLGLVTYLKNRKQCNIGQVKLDDMIVIRLCEDQYNG